MRAAWIILALAVVSLAQAFGQTAKVYELTPDEAAAAKSLYAKQGRINADIESLRNHIGTKYFHQASGYCYSGNVNGQYVDTCGVDFEFSEDFRFVVPKPTPALQTISPTWGSNGTYAIPNVAPLVNGPNLMTMPDVLQ